MERQRSTARPADDQRVKAPWSLNALRLDLPRWEGERSDDAFWPLLARRALPAADGFDGLSGSSASRCLKLSHFITELLLRFN